MFMLPKLAGSAVSPLQVAFFRYLAGFCIILPFFLRSYGLRQALPEFATPAKRPLTAGHALRGSIGIAGVALGAYAVTHIPLANAQRSEEHTSELQSLMSISYAVFCLKKKNNRHTVNNNI